MKRIHVLTAVAAAVLLASCGGSDGDEHREVCRPRIGRARRHPVHMRPPEPA